LLARIVLERKNGRHEREEERVMVFSTANNGLPFSGPEVETIFASQRKNAEAIMQAIRLAFDGVQAVWLRQLDFVQEAVEGLTTHVGDIAPPSGP